MEAIIMHIFPTDKIGIASMTPTLKKLQGNKLENMGTRLSKLHMELMLTSSSIDKQRHSKIFSSQ